MAEQSRLDVVELMEQVASVSERSAPAGTSMLVWQRAEQQQAAQRRPSASSPEIIGHHPQVERRLREIA